MMRKQLGLPLSILVPGVLVAAGLSNVSCSRVECGSGTVEREGACVPADMQPGNANCAPGTVLGAMGCEVETPTQCDPATTIEDFDEETGITTCVGVGGEGCTGSFACATPDGTHVTVCGNLFDSQTDLQVVATAPTAARCNPAAPTADGPCSLDVKFYDALDFAQNPDTAQPLTPMGGVYVDDCGRYKGEHIPQPTFGFIGVAVDDAGGTPDRHRRTGVATANGAARPALNFRAYVTRVETDMLWTTQAGLTGMTFSQRGVLAIVFRHGTNSIAGVQIQKDNNNVPNDDFYFSDSGNTRGTLDPARTNTGPNGTGLVINAPSPIAFDGAGGEPGGCQWPTNLAAAIPGVTFVQIKQAEMPGGAPCP
jgi:hypothetical protein